MATPRIPYPDHGQGISFFFACCPSHPLDLQSSALSLPLGFVSHTPLSVDKASFGG
jgi:hypothetical protein